MACGLAVKRPHEYDYETYLSPESAVETKRSRPSNQPHCSPFRPQLGTLAASLMQSSASASKENEEVLNTGPLGFVKTTQLSGTQLEAYLTAEVQYLKRRKLIPSRAGHQSQSGGESSHDKLVTESSTSYRQGAVSPSSCHSGSDSDSETGSALDNRTSPQGKLMSMEALYEKPQLSLKQVKLICDRLLKEQEIRLRYEYETALNKKLEEQHESYVQFAKEQIDSRHSNNECFYLS